MSDNNASITKLKKATSDASTAKHPTNLNSVVLLHILSYTDAETVCRFSRTCSWSKQLVDANIQRLPQVEFSRARITVNRSSVAYYLITSTKHKLEVEKECFEVETILTWARYGCLKDFHLICESIQPHQFRTVLGAVLEAGITLNLVEWKGLEGSFRASASIYDCKTSFSSYLRNLIMQPLEAIFSSCVSAENDHGIHEILAMAVQCMVGVEVGLLGAARTKNECLLFLAKTIKALEGGSNGMCAPDLFPTITLHLMRDGLIQFTAEDRNLLLVHLMEHGLTPRYSIRNGLATDVRLNCEDQTCHIHVRCKTNELRIKCEEDVSQFVHRLQQVISRPDAVAATLERLKKNLYGYFRFTSGEVVDVVLEAMRRHKKKYRIVAAGLDVFSEAFTASEAYAFLSSYPAGEMRRPILSMLLDLMEAQVLEQEIVGSCCCMLLKLRIPVDYEFDFAVQIMIIVFTRNQHIALKQKDCLSLLYAMLYRMTVQQKKQIGKTGVIEDVLQLVEREYREFSVFQGHREPSDTWGQLWLDFCLILELTFGRHEYYDYSCLTESWNFLFHVTDGIPENLEHFVEGEGVTLLWKCYEKFQDRWSMVESMTGIVSNIRLHDAVAIKVLRSAESNGRWSIIIEKNLSVAVEEVLAHQGGELYRRLYNAGVIEVLQRPQMEDLPKRMRKLSKSGKSLSSTAFKEFIAYQGKRKIVQQQGKRRMYR